MWDLKQRDGHCRTLPCLPMGKLLLPQNTVQGMCAVESTAIADCEAYCRFTQGVSKCYSNDPQKLLRT